MGHVDNEIPAASTEILTIASRRATNAAPTHTASIGKYGVPNTVTPLTATAVAALTSAYVHRNREPVLTLTPAWAIGEHRPDGAQQICVD
jgi:microcystin-dependent protein